MSGLRVPFRPMPGEVLHGYVSRLARAFLTDARTFCRDLGLSFPGLVCGRREEVDRLAWLVGEPAAELSRRAPVGDSRPRVLAGQQLSPNLLRCRRLLVCPACLRGDVVASRLPPEQAAYARATWLVRPIRTCAAHGLALQSADDVGDRSSGDWQHDLATRLRPLLADLDARVGRALHRQASDLERYLGGRLEGAPPATPIMDALPFDCAVAFAETVGAVATLGREVRTRDLDEEALREAGAVGHSILAGGEASLRGLLADLRASNARDGNWNNPVGAAYGPIYRLLKDTRQARDYEPVREIVRRHILETTPVAAGTEVLGEEVPVRTIHSFRSATKRLNRPGVRLRAALADSGLLAKGPSLVTPAKATFDAEGAEELLGRFRDGLSLGAAGKRLGLHRRTLKLVVAAGLVEHRPLPRGAATNWCFEPEILDAFLGRLIADARDIREPGGDVQDVFRAGEMLREPVTAILSLVVERRLDWVGLRPDCVGCRAVLVDVREVEAMLGATRDPADDLVPARDLCAILRVRDGSVRKLIESGAIPSEPAPRMGSKKLVDCVRRRDLEWFDGEFSTPRRYAGDRGLSLAAVRSSVTAAGLEPAFPVESCGIPVYRRSDLDRMFPS